MKKIIIMLSVGLIGSIGYGYYLSHEVAELKTAQARQEKYIEALDKVVHSLDYKKNSQLYLLCSNPSPETLQLLADSCKADCIKYKLSE